MKIIWIVAILLYSSQTWADVLQAKVVAVNDGDSITVLSHDNVQYRVRLAGIDAPEKGQPFRKASKDSLSDLVYGKIVTLDVSKIDRYGRVLSKITVGDVDVNLEQIKRGLAWFYWKYQSELMPEDRVAYREAHETAMVSKVGLWAEASPVAPWDWRVAWR